MNAVSATVIQSMFNHLAASYTEDEAREILVQKYPDAEDVLANIKPENYRVTKVEMGSVSEVIEPAAEVEAKPAKKAKAPKVKAPKAEKPAKVAKEKAPKAEKPVVETAPKAESKADRARAMYAAATDKSRAAMIALFMAELGMSKAAASTYYYNVKG